MASGLWHYGKLDDVIPFPIGANDTSGSGDDGASPTAFVRKVGDGAGVAPVQEPTPILLSHVNYPAGCYALEITASTGNGYANEEKYLVYTSLAVDAQNPTGALGGFELSADGGVALRGADGDNLKDLSDQIDAIPTTKTGYSLSTAGILAIWHQLTAAIVTASTIGKLIIDFLNAAITSRAVAGDNMNLADDAITSAKYDESSAFPIKSVDTGASQIARVGADGDTLETLSGQLDGIQADLDNPGQYKADVSGLATSAELITHDNKLAPVALDGGGATIGGMLTKLADDNGGADFDAGDDSLERIRNTAPLGTATPTAVQNRQEMDSNSTQLAAIVADTNEMQGKLPSKAKLMGSADADGGLDSEAKADIKSEVEAAHDTAIPGSPTADSINEVLKNQAKAASTFVEGAAVAGTLSTTEMTTDLTEVTDDHYNGLTLKWTSGVLQDQATAVTDYDGATKKLVYVATTEAPSIGDTFVLA